MKAARPALDPAEWNDRYRDYLIRFAHQRTSDHGTAEDLVQDTFLSAWNARDRFRGDCGERTWLTGILRNKIIDFYRRNDRRPSVLATDLDSNQDDGDTRSWMDRQPDLRVQDEPVAVAERSEFMEALDEAVTHLPPTMGKAFRMRELQGYSTEEITKALDITKSNLWVLIHRAKAALSEELRPNWRNHGEFGERRAA